MCTYAFIPAHEEPIERFLHGNGALQRAGDGKVFTIWDALIGFPESAYPLIIGDRRLSWEKVVWAAGQHLRGAQHRLDPDTFAKVRAVCVAEGFDPDFLT
jgi:hypothetical protein